MNCTKVSTNSEYYYQYIACEEPGLVVLNALLLLCIVLCLCFGCSRDKYTRIGP